MGSYYCSCTKNYKGDTCIDDVDECIDYKPCQNSGTCKVSSLAHGMNGAICTVKHRSYFVIAVIYDITCMIPLLVTFCDITCNVLFLIIFNVLFLALQLRTQWALIIVPVLKTIKEILASMMLMSV